jgi:hypothetical protein
MWKRFSRLAEYSILIAALTSVIAPTVQRHELKERGIRIGLRLGAKIADASPAWQLPPASSAIPQQACFEAERFASYDDWARAVNDWNSRRPPLPNPLQAWKGYQVAKTEDPFARSHFKSDKQMHCYVGCRIAQETDFTTAQFAAWEKERRDLTDCNSESHFEDMDYTVTVWGAHLGIATSSSSECLSTCERSF